MSNQAVRAKADKQNTLTEQALDEAFGQAPSDAANDLVRTLSVRLQENPGRIAVLPPVVSEKYPVTMAEAVAVLQGMLPEVTKGRVAKVKGKTKDGEPFEYSYNFADLADVTKAIMPLMSQVGLSFTAMPTLSDKGHFVLDYEYAHVSGQFKRGQYPLNAQARPQEIGSAITYARRYILCGLTGLVAEDDDDAAAAKPAEDMDRSPMPQKLAARLLAQLSTAKLADLPKLWEHIADFHAIDERAGASELSWSQAFAQAFARIAGNATDHASYGQLLAAAKAVVPISARGPWRVMATLDARCKAIDAQAFQNAQVLSHAVDTAETAEQMATVRTKISEETVIDAEVRLQLMSRADQFLNEHAPQGTTPKPTEGDAERYHQVVDRIWSGEWPIIGEGMEYIDTLHRTGEINDIHRDDLNDMLVNRPRVVVSGWTPNELMEFLRWQIDISGTEDDLNAIRTRLNDDQRHGDKAVLSLTQARDMYAELSARRVQMRGTPA